MSCYSAMYVVTLFFLFFYYFIPSCSSYGFDNTITLCACKAEYCFVLSVSVCVSVYLRVCTITEKLLIRN